MPILPNEDIKFNQVKINSTTLDLTIKEAKEKRAKILIKKHILNRMSEMVNNEPDTWVLIIQLLNSTVSTKTPGYLQVLYEETPYGIINIYISKDGIFVKSPIEDDSVISELLKNKLIDVLIKHIMFLFYVFTMLSHTAKVVYICDIDNLTLDTQPLTDNPRQEFEIIGDSYGGRELMTYIFNEVLKP